MGRPKSVKAHARVLAAAGALFADQGIDATSMDAIAEASGVSKATIYKHWPDKGALCLEVMSSLHAAEPLPALPPSARRPRRHRRLPRASSAQAADRICGRASCRT